MSADSDINFQVDLPAFPHNIDLSQSHGGGAIRIIMWQGPPIEGKLLEFDSVGRSLIVQPDTSDTIIVNFDAMKYAGFRQKITVPTLEMPPADGRIDYRDGTVWHGKVAFFLIGQHGLHLLVASNTSVHRYFVPVNSVKSYHLGNMTTITPPAGKTQLHSGSQPFSQGATDASDETSDTEPAQHRNVDTAQYASAEKLGLQLVKLRNVDAHEEAVSLVPEEIARQHRLIPINKVDNTLVIAMTDPTSNEAINLIGFITGLTPDPVMTTDADLDWALDHYYSPSHEVAAFDAEIESSTEEVDKQLLIQAHKMGSERPIVKLVNDIFAQAISKKASDIHLRPGEKGVELLLRIDGNLILIREFAKGLLRALVSRIKIIGGMDIATRMVPQDGQTRVVESGVVIDMRISVIPTINGESVVVRILNTKYGPMSIQQLGMTKDEESGFLNFLAKSHGMILVTGPTGSGKSTTLYAALDVVKQKNLSIITVEDPVEFHIPGIDQVQISEQRGLTFARVLRNILRHDPEVIMVGEVRDSETAKIAVQSALTGHLVLSTLHTNNAIGALSRMSDMGVEPYLLGPTLLCVIAQRLLRKVCPQCRTADTVQDAWRHALKIDEQETFYKGSGCENCNGRGMSGRVGVYEVLAVSEKLAGAIPLSEVYGLASDS